MPALSALVSKYQKRIEEVPRRSSVRMTDLTVLGTPVDTGSARASWHPNIGKPAGRNVETAGGAGYPQRSSVMAVANALQIGQSFSLGNGLPYIRRLEYGYSAQAPGGMLRVAAAQWRPVVAEAVRDAKRGI